MRLGLVTLLILTVACGTLFASGGVVPEIDPSGLSSAVALVAGGCLIAASKFRRRK